MGPGIARSNEVRILKESRKLLSEDSPTFVNLSRLTCRNFGLEATDPAVLRAIDEDQEIHARSPNCSGCLLDSISPRPTDQQDAAAVKLQKVYKSYRTRRSLADCAVLVEELWWKARDFASLKRSSLSSDDDDDDDDDDDKPAEKAISRWAFAGKRAAKLGKGLSKDEKAQKLALRHWLEAIDPRHRYGHNLHLYYDVWFESESTEQFFYWLDIGDGREVSLDSCPRSELHRQCIRYLGPKEREAYEVVVKDGRLVNKISGSLVDTVKVSNSRWIFVLSTSRSLYVGKKVKGTFHHSSFLSGGATTAAGRLVARAGILQAIWPQSGHYLPTEENFDEFINFLRDNDVDLSNVKRGSVDDHDYNFSSTGEAGNGKSGRKDGEKKLENYLSIEGEGGRKMEKEMDMQIPVSEHDINRRSCKWTTGVGPRIGCVRDYPIDLQSKGLEQVNLSPRITPSPGGNKVPIPSPRPSSTMRLSPRLACMGLPSPTHHDCC